MRLLNKKGKLSGLLKINPNQANSLILISNYDFEICGGVIIRG